MTLHSAVRSYLAARRELMDAHTALLRAHTDGHGPLTVARAVYDEALRSVDRARGRMELALEENE